VGQRRRITPLDQEAGHLVLHGFRRAADPGRDDRLAEGGGFQRDTTERLRPHRRLDDDICEPVQDLDLGVGCGTAIPDRSGRYHGTLSGTTWSHYIGTCPTELPSGSGTVSRGLRRYTQTISAKDGDTVTVTHGLGTTNLTVAVWNAAGGSVQTAVQRKAGNETNAIDLGFALVGAPSTPVNFLVVVIG